MTFPSGYWHCRFRVETQCRAQCIPVVIDGFYFLANSGELADFHDELFAVEVRQFHVEFPRRTGEHPRQTGELESTFSLLSVGYHCVYFVGYLWHGTKTFMTPFQLFSDCAVKRHSHLVANSHPRCINTLNTQPLWKVRMCKCW